MIERIVIFLVLGTFVFTPEIGNWSEENFTAWYDVYIAWMILIIAVLWIEWRRKANQG